MLGVLRQKDPTRDRQAAFGGARKRNHFGIAVADLQNRADVLGNAVACRLPVEDALMVHDVFRDVNRTAGLRAQMGWQLPHEDHDHGRKPEKIAESIGFHR